MPEIDYFADLPPMEESDPITLERLTMLAADARELTSEIDKDTIALEEKKGRLTRILTERIPNIMDSLGMELFRLQDGAEISVKDDVKCSLSEDRKPAAFTWLEENDYDGIIKTTVTAAFNKGEIEQAKKALEILSASGFLAELDRTIHPQTLKAFVKERLEIADSGFPVETFGVFEYRIAKIKEASKATKPRNGKR